MARYVIRITEEDLKRAADMAPEWEAEHAARMARDARDRRFLDVDASDWRSMADFYEVALPLLGIAELSDRSPGTLVAAMARERTGVAKPPYTLRISSIAALPVGLTAGLRRLQERVRDARTRSLVDGWATFAVHVELLPHRGLRASGNGRLVIDIDASRWVSSGDLYDAILPQLGAPDWHGANMNALTESMI